MVRQFVPATLKYAHLSHAITIQSRKGSQLNRLAKWMKRKHQNLMSGTTKQPLQEQFGAGVGKILPGHYIAEAIRAPEQAGSVR